MKEYYDLFMEGQIAMEINTSYSFLNSIYEKLKSKIETLKHLLNTNAQLDNATKTYYQTHLWDFATIYYYFNHLSLFNHQHETFEKAGFHHFYFQDNPQQFTILKHYADNNRIISMVGDICDLTHFDQYPIACINISNVGDYIPLQISLSQNTPIIIWTDDQIFYTRYYSFKYKPNTMSQQKMAQQQQYLNKLAKKLLKGGMKPLTYGLHLFYIDLDQGDSEEFEDLINITKLNPDGLAIIERYLSHSVNCAPPSFCHPLSLKLLKDLMRPISRLSK